MSTTLATTQVEADFLPDAMVFNGTAVATGLHRSVRNVIEFAFRMQKHKSLSFNSRYRVEIYEGWKMNSKTRIDDRQKKYDTEIFPLYQSYAGGHRRFNCRAWR